MQAGRQGWAGAHRAAHLQASNTHLLRGKTSWEKQFPQPRVSPGAAIAAGIELLAAPLGVLH